MGTIRWRYVCVVIIPLTLFTWNWNVIDHNGPDGIAVVIVVASVTLLIHDWRICFVVAAYDPHREDVGSRHVDPARTRRWRPSHGVLVLFVRELSSHPKSVLPMLSKHARHVWWDVRQDVYLRTPSGLYTVPLELVFGRSHWPSHGGHHASITPGCPETPQMEEWGWGLWGLKNVFFVLFWPDKMVWYHVDVVVVLVRCRGHHRKTHPRSQVLVPMSFVSSFVPGRRVPLIGSLSMQRFWATDGNRKLTFCRPGHCSLPHFQSNRLY